MRYDRVIEYRHRSLLYGFSGRKCRIRGTAYYGRSTQTPPTQPSYPSVYTCVFVSLLSSLSVLSVSIYPFIALVLPRAQSPIGVSGAHSRKRSTLAVFTVIGRPFECVFCTEKCRHNISSFRSCT